MKLSVFEKSIAYQKLFCLETYLVSSSNHEGDGNEEIKQATSYISKEKKITEVACQYKNDLV